MLCLFEGGYMQARWRRVRVGAVLVKLTTALGMTGVVALAVVTPGHASGAYITLDPTKVAESIAYLTKAYGVSKEEALRRLQLQKDAEQLGDTLGRERRSQFGGMWL